MKELKRCQICGKTSENIAEVLGVCNECIKNYPEKAEVFIKEAHTKTRKLFGLPAHPPKAKEGIKCKICANECVIPEGEVGFCGLRPSLREAKVSWYLDPLPTNCVADWVCPGSKDHGHYNLAVFFHACSMNCLFCQNWHFRELTFKSEVRSVEDMLKALNPYVTCVCFFGGDPSVQLPFALKFSEEALKVNKAPELRICWETNGMMNTSLLKKAVELSLVSGGCIKFDLKAWNPHIHKALTGVTNEKILENFKIACKFIEKRPEPPLVIASTLLVPGYVDEEEVFCIARFIAEINPEIPYRLLAFYPQFFMKDLPTTSKELAYSCYESAKRAGLKRVSIGNIHLLM